MSPTASQKVLDWELAIFNDPSYQAFQPALEQWLTRLRSLGSVEEAMSFELELMAQIGAREQAMPHLDEVRALPRRALQLLDRTAPGVMKARHVSQLERAAHIERLFRALWQIERDIADGLAWRALDFDRTQITVLSEGREVAHLTHGRGLDAEVNTMEAIFRQTGTLVLHNDTTRCLRVGDLTQVVPQADGSRLANPIEVKASGRVKPGSRQARRLARAQERLAHGRVVAPVDYQSFLPSVAQVIAEARGAGFAMWQPTPAITVFAADFRHFGGGRAEELGRLREEAEREAGLLDGKPRVAHATTVETRLLDRRTALANIAPMSIFPLPLRDVAELLLGFVSLSIYVNLELLRELFARNGIFVSLSGGDGFFSARSGGATVMVPGAVQAQMLHELLTPGALLTLLNFIFESGLASQLGSGQTVIGFSGERKVWSFSSLPAAGPLPHS